ncbi:HlyD family secretion protein [Photobacterium gaetbulicola]|uniref:Putative multidrug resistance efflux pump n=1 Tax=Photobacterium gaetbulicola Gung47 TaxID=658445 RepID=A0A0C5WGE6_9GAMM|nr:biotin/lipoyl-binding protein [Photobacterium gaetbulicola]AJR06208.1 putative multidrug resistance efflux pump [Photobacterium gaetbulicola Gung47]PST98824.1 HlyD family secretion protein [Photobacterium gaetbulicola]
MLEGLAVWALFIYILRLVGMPWNKGTKLFAYIGGTSWLIFVWIGLITYTPMDMSGGSVVQSPHIQLRPASSEVKGVVTAIHIEPNQKIKKGQLIYEIDDEPYLIAVENAKAELAGAEMGLRGQIKLIELSRHQQDAAEEDLELKVNTLARYKLQEIKVADTVSKQQLERRMSEVEMAKIKLSQAKLKTEQIMVNVFNAETVVAQKQTAVDKAQWNLANTKIYAPVDGFVTNFIMREGQYVGAAPRLAMYTNEKYVLTRVNHQALRNVKKGQLAEFGTAIYPGKVFSASVDSIIEATGESQGSLLAVDDNVRRTTGLNVLNKHHFVRLKIHEPEGFDIPVGAVGLAWISGEKPTPLLSFLDAIRGIVIRVKTQIYYLYSL